METMIVLVVTSVFFLMAMIAVGGKQNETEFQQAINDAQSDIQQAVAAVNSGDYQETNNITCQDVGNRVSISLSGGSGSTEGTSSDCIFIGKVLQFTNHTGSNPEGYVSYPIAGLRVNNGNIANAAPVAVAPDSGLDSSFPSDGVSTYLHDGLTISYMHFVGGSTTNIGAFGIMSGLGATSGEQQLYLVPISSTGYNYDPNNTSDMITAVSAINSNLASSYTNALNLVNSATPNYSVQICFASGTTNQSGLLTIGGNGGDLNSVTTSIFNGSNCT